MKSTLETIIDQKRAFLDDTWHYLQQYFSKKYNTLDSGDAEELRKIIESDKIKNSVVKIALHTITMEIEWNGITNLLRKMANSIESQEDVKPNRRNNLDRE